jgi:hypothetical protein
MMELMELREIEAVNPYKPGSEEWHRHNLGIEPDVIGHIDSVEVTPGGVLLVKGTFWGTIPPTLAGWFIDDHEARLIKKEGSDGTATTPGDSPPGAP